MNAFVRKLESFKFKDLPASVGRANDDDDAPRSMSFDDLASRVRITRNDVVSAQAELARAEQAHEDAIREWNAASAELTREPVNE